MKALAGKLCLVIAGENTGKQVRALRLYEGDLYTSKSPIWWVAPVSKDIAAIDPITKRKCAVPAELLCSEHILMPIDPDETLENETIGEDQNARV